MLASLDLELVLAFPDLELGLVSLALGLVLVFLALGQVQVQVRDLLAWAEMTPELREGRPLPPSTSPAPRLRAQSDSPLGSPESHVTRVTDGSGQARKPQAAWVALSRMLWPLGASFSPGGC